MSFMTLTNYLRDKKLSIALKLICLLFVALFLSVLKVRWEAIVVIAFLFVCAWVIPAFVDFWKRRSFYNTLLKTLDALDKKYLITELMGKPTFLESRILEDIIREVDLAMINHVNEYKNMQKEYKEYIELWIHEAKIPLAASKLIIENNPTNTMKHVGDELDKLNNYLEQALYYARSQYVEKDYIIRELRIRDVIEDVLKRNSRVFIERKISVDLAIKNEVVYSDSKWLSFILHQIIQNSLKYTNPGKGLLSFRVENHEYYIKLIIKDNGIGIADEDLPKVFEKGFTGKNGRLQTTSTGIGLYLCKKLCDKLNHEIHITSDQGTCVTLSFPKDSSQRTKM